jgi:hypothetical protein
MNANPQNPNAPSESEAGSRRTVRRIVQTRERESFELFRLSKSKAAVDVSPNTLRSYFKQGLPCYKRGKAVFVSRSELAQFIMG